MASSPLPLRLHPPLSSAPQRSPLKSNSPAPSRARLTATISVSASASDSSPWEREEARWLREEQRWLREEQRWLREQARWAAERDSLLRELAALRARALPALDLGGPRTSLDAPPAGPRAALVEGAEVKEMVVEEVRVAESAAGAEREEKKRKKTLKRGSEGEDVREMQDALQRLGFYSGEEDMEFASFSSGTERAVKTWQASVGITEDGIMTVELLERLLMEQGISDAAPKANAEDDHPNGAPIASVTEMAEIQQTVVKESGDSEVQVSQPRVFLLGENRWEEPSRLVGRDKPISRSKAVSTTKCLSCHGEGRLMCTECDGSGEPNIEPQFLEWVDEGAKCPYCEGLGYTICDICEGKGTTV